MKTKELIKILRKAGFISTNCKSSHQKWQNGRNFVVIKPGKKEQKDYIVKNVLKMLDKKVL